MAKPNLSQYMNKATSKKQKAELRSVLETQEELVPIVEEPVLEQEQVSVEQETKNEPSQPYSEVLTEKTLHEYNKTIEEIADKLQKLEEEMKELREIQKNQAINEAAVPSGKKLVRKVVINRDADGKIIDANIIEE